MSRILYFDCFSGASGDMVLGALIDAGLPLAELRTALGSLAIDGASVSATKVIRAGVSATKFQVHEDAPPASARDHAFHGGHSHDHGSAHDHSHSHDHEHSHGNHQHSHEPSGVAVAPAHGHRSLSEIRATIDRSALSAAAKTRAQDLFQRLGEVEAGIHQIPLERIHLHEVGALDSIIDIVGAVFALEWFAADRIVSSSLNVGSGMVKTAHGLFPVPAPATLKLLEGVPIYSSGAERELVTPTGALIVSSYASAFGPVPAMKVERIGYGAGDRDPGDTPNVLRVLVGEEAGSSSTERITVLECEIDDMNPQIFGSVMDKLYEAGALEVYFAPVQMKKNRPGTLMTVLARPHERQSLLEIVFRETTTIGVRHHDVARTRLDRQIVEVGTPVGSIRFKIARLGGDIVNAAPEFEDCARIATEHGMPIKDVQALAVKAYLESREQRAESKP